MSARLSEEMLLFIAMGSVPDWANAGDVISILAASVTESTGSLRANMGHHPLSYFVTEQNTLLTRNTLGYNLHYSIHDLTPPNSSRTSMLAQECSTHSEKIQQTLDT